MDWDRCLRGCARLALALLGAAALLGAPIASAEVVAIDGISLPPLARALVKNPVQLRGNPDPGLTSAQVRALTSLIAHRDAGRIRIAVITPMSEHDVGVVANTVGNRIPKDGVLIVVGAYHFYVVTTWGNNAAQILTGAVQDPRLTLDQALTRAVIAFAKADHKAGHPTPLAEQLGGSAPKPGAPTGATNPDADTGAATTPNPSTGTSPAPAATTTPTTAKAHRGGGVSAGVIIGLIVAVLVLAAVGVIAFGRGARSELKERHYQQEAEDDARAAVQKDFIKLGERIGDLDIDSSMPNASDEGKRVYATAVECYQDAEQRLKHPDDEYQYGKAKEAIRTGLQHVEQANRLFNPSSH